MKPVHAAAAAVLLLAGCDKQAEKTPAATESASTPAVATPAASSTPAAPAAAIAPTGAAIAHAIAANGKAEARVTEATRANGVLTINVQFQRAPGSDSVSTLFTDSETKDGLYVVAGEKKYFPLTDAESKPLMVSSLMLRLDEKEPVAGIWFGKFPAPPPEIKSVSLVLPNVAPLDNIPLTDR